MTTMTTTTTTPMTHLSTMVVRLLFSWIFHPMGATRCSCIFPTRHCRVIISFPPVTWPLGRFLIPPASAPGIASGGLWSVLSPGGGKARGSWKFDRWIECEGWSRAIVCWGAGKLKFPTHHHFLYDVSMTMVPIWVYVLHHTQTVAHNLS